MQPLYMRYNIVPTVAITKEVQRRTHKKYRINKKWLKRYGYKTVPDNEKIIIVYDTLYVTPKGVERLYKMINEEGDK